MAGRSSMARLPPGILADVHEAIREGATIGGITERIRSYGETCSRSAVTRYVRRTRAVLQRRREVEGRADLWLGTACGPPEGDKGRRALEALGALAMRSPLALEGGGEPPDVDQIATLALAMQRIEGGGKSGADRESAIAHNPEREDVGRFPSANRSGGLSPKTVAHIRAAVEGCWGQGGGGGGGGRSRGPGLLGRTNATCGRRSGGAARGPHPCDAPPWFAISPFEPLASDRLEPPRPTLSHFEPE